MIMCVASMGSSRETESRSEPKEELGSDEVKVFDNEGEEEQEEEQAKLDLQEEKSSLIIESERDKHADGRARLDSFSAGLQASAAFMSPYFAAAYPGFAAYANGSAAAASATRSPFLYEDPLSSPPPAHLGAYLDKTAAAAAAAAAGLRSSLYPLGPAQYPYPMLAPEHLAAWHHQASIYQHAGALRAASPYGLPITSTSVSPMPRYSPTGLLGHPGLAAGLAAAAAASPAAAAGSSGNGGAGGRPKAELDHAHRKEGHAHSSPQKNRKEPHIKKPLNAFMLYMKEMRPTVQSECTLKESAAINQILGRRWHKLSREEQAKYYERARVEKQKHMQIYPHWNARDNYRFGGKRKKRRRDKTQDDQPGSSMKKCRARYGLSEQHKWCKPCRRKKKCERVLTLLNAASSTPGQEENSEMNSDGEEEEDSSSHDSESQRKHAEEHSEHESITSPAAISSIGSPAGSIASPATPMQLPNPLNNALPNFEVMPEWLGGRGGAFRPPGPLRPGLDPRDSKHPLSVTQLTKADGAKNDALLGL